jgi:hypothetical protein
MADTYEFRRRRSLIRRIDWAEVFTAFVLVASIIGGIALALTEEADAVTGESERPYVAAGVSLAVGGVAWSALTLTVLAYFSWRVAQSVEGSAEAD